MASVVITVAAISAEADAIAIAEEDAAAISVAIIVADPAPDTVPHTQYQSLQR